MPSWLLLASHVLRARTSQEWQENALAVPRVYVRRHVPVAVAADLSRHLRRSVAPVRAGCPAARHKLSLSSSQNLGGRTGLTPHGTDRLERRVARFLSVACRRGLMTSFRNLAHLHISLYHWLNHAHTRIMHTQE